MRVSQEKFLILLQQEADYQAKLEQQRLLPKQLEGFARLVAKYPWQIVALAATISAGIVEIGGRW